MNKIYGKPLIEITSRKEDRTEIKYAEQLKIWLARGGVIVNE